ncbi:MAG: PucR family transcriptional regulator, partial [Actinomycetes bacterium]
MARPEVAQPLPAPALPAPAPETVRRVEQSTSLLAAAALVRMDAQLGGSRAMGPAERSWVGLVAQAGIAAFVAWFRDPTQAPTITADVFGTAPRELTRAVTLQQTVELVRATIDVVESQIEVIVPADEQPLLREAVLRYSREVAFAAADIYAKAAEARGAWDARLEALVVDALLRGDTDDALQSRVAALGWQGHDAVAVVVGNSPSGTAEDAVAEVRRAAQQAADDALVGVRGDRLVVVLGSSTDPQA